ncbi:unnamed protein product [Amoebophrya sp. A25]|nr:unnamed protein product [Amoebophrya sp. A25]|eukprot:GSA25T00002511001.1
MLAAIPEDRPLVSGESRNTAAKKKKQLEGSKKKANKQCAGQRDNKTSEAKPQGTSKSKALLAEAAAKTVSTSRGSLCAIRCYYKRRPTGVERFYEERSFTVPKALKAADLILRDSIGPSALGCGAVRGRSTLTSTLAKKPEAGSSKASAEAGPTTTGATSRTHVDGKDQHRQNRKDIKVETQNNKGTTKLTPKLAWRQPPASDEAKRSKDAAGQDAKMKGENDGEPSTKRRKVTPTTSTTHVKLEPQTPNQTVGVPPTQRVLNPASNTDTVMDAATSTSLEQLQSDIAMLTKEDIAAMFMPPPEQQFLFPSEAQTNQAAWISDSKLTNTEVNRLRKLKNKANKKLGEGYFKEEQDNMARAIAQGKAKEAKQQEKQVKEQEKAVSKNNPFAQEDQGQARQASSAGNNPFNQQSSASSTSTVHPSQVKNPYLPSPPNAAPVSSPVQQPVQHHPPIIMNPEELIVQQHEHAQQAALGVGVPQTAFSQLAPMTAASFAAADRGMITTKTAREAVQLATSSSAGGTPGSAPIPNTAAGRRPVSKFWEAISATLASNVPEVVNQTSVVPALTRKELGRLQLTATGTGAKIGAPTGAASSGDDQKQSFSTSGVYRAFAAPKTIGNPDALKSAAAGVLEIPAIKSHNASVANPFVSAPPTPRVGALSGVGQTTLGAFPPILTSTTPAGMSSTSMTPEDAEAYKKVMSLFGETDTGASSAASTLPPSIAELFGSSTSGATSSSGTSPATVDILARLMGGQPTTSSSDKMPMPPPPTKMPPPPLKSTTTPTANYKAQEQHAGEKAEDKKKTKQKLKVDFGRNRPAWSIRDEAESMVIASSSSWAVPGAQSASSTSSGGGGDPLAAALEAFVEAGGDPSILDLPSSGDAGAPQLPHLSSSTSTGTPPGTSSSSAQQGQGQDAATKKIPKGMMVGEQPQNKKSQGAALLEYQKQKKKRVRAHKGAEKRAAAVGVLRPPVAVLPPPSVAKRTSNEAHIKRHDDTTTGTTPGQGHESRALAAASSAGASPLEREAGRDVSNEDSAAMLNPFGSDFDDVGNPFL